MELEVGEFYGKDVCVTDTWTMDTALGPCETTVNYWKKQNAECVTQRMEVPSNAEYGVTGWLQKQLAIAQALKRCGFEPVTTIEGEAIVWERDR